MQITSRFTIAVHMLLCMDIFQEEYKVTSDLMASSIGVNPVVVRKLLQQLKDAGLAEVKRGPGGAAAARPLEEITFLDIYRAVDCIGENTLFHFHDNPSPDCPVGKNIHQALDNRLTQVQEAMERELQSITLAVVKQNLLSMSGK